MGKEIETKRDKKSEFILTGNLYKVILKLAIPIMLANLIQTIYNLTDTYFVSRIGDIEVGAVGMVWPIIFCFIGLGGGISLGAVALISQSIGAKDESAARKASGQIIIFSFLLGIVMCLLGYVVSPFILRAMGATGQIYTLAWRYLSIIYIGIPFMYVFFAFQAIEQAQGNMTLPMLLSGVSVVLNIVLDVLFILVLGLGVAGAAYATIIARVLLGIFSMIYYFASSKRMYKPTIRELRPNFGIIAKICKIGIPASVGQVTTAVGFIVVNGFVLSYGSSVLTAFVIGNRIVSLAVMPCFGIGSALSTIVGQHLGAGYIDRTKRVLYAAAKVSVMVGAVGVILLLFTREPFIRAFTDDNNVIAQALDYSLMITLALPLMGIYNVWTGFFIGAGNGTFSMLTMISRLWIFRIPSILVLKYVIHMNEYAIWYPIIISNALACLLGFALYKRGNIFRSFLANKRQMESSTIKEG